LRKWVDKATSPDLSGNSKKKERCGHGAESRPAEFHRGSTKKNAAWAEVVGGGVLQRRAPKKGKQGDPADTNSI